LVSSTSEAIRLINGGGIKINGEKITDSKFIIGKGKSFTIQVGKRRFAKINT
jgi:tyrosyl-tRNA synthetase